MKVSKLFLSLIILLPFLLVFRSFFSASHLVWGDAPYFYLENLKELFNKPLLWDFRNNNFGSPQNGFLWLYIPTFLMGFLNQIFNLNSDVLIRIVFYFPAVIISFFGSWLFLGRYFKGGLRIFGAIFYSLNSYNLTLIDGGQIGVGLAYGIFPLTTYFLLESLYKRDVKSFFYSFLTFLLLTNVDIRVSVLLLFLTVILITLDLTIDRDVDYFKKKISNLFLILISTCLVDLFWLLPFIKGANALTLNVGEDNFISLLDSFLIYQPHFPINEFGHLLSVPFYYGFLPILFFLGITLKPSRRFAGWGIIFLFLVFLSKGGSEPAGGIYKFLVDKIPLGSSFRDSTKFYTPLILVASLLITQTVQVILETVKNSKLKLFFCSVVFAYLLILIYPALVGSLTGVLGKTANNFDYQTIYQNISRDGSFSRSLWFPEKPPLAFADWNHPAISADELSVERPFASMIDGTYDLFNFLHNKNLESWYKLLGIKYVFYPTDPRKKIWTDNDLKERSEFINFVTSSTKLQPLNWSLSVPAYINSQVMPHIFGQKKAILVIGGDELYQHMNLSDNNLAKIGSVFLEDNQFNLNNLFSINPVDAILVFENGDDRSLSVLLSKKVLIGPTQAITNDWKTYQGSNYLKWKSELLNNGIRNYDFDLGQGIATSSINGESLEFKEKIRDPGSYLIGVRTLEGSEGGSISISINNQSTLISKSDNFNWSILGPINLDKDLIINIKNLGGFTAFNSIALIKKEDWDSAQQETYNLESQFTTIKINSLNDWSRLSSFIPENFIPINYQLINPTMYKLNLTPDIRWVVFTDHYNQNWQLGNGLNFPFYSMVNGFYNLNPKGQYLLIYGPQVREDNYINYSLISLLIILIGLFYLSMKKDHNHKSLREIHEDVPADHYDQGIKRNLFQRYWHLKRIKKLKQFLFKTNGKILDVGCHGGLLTEQIQKVNQKAKIYGIDISPSAIKLAKRRIKQGIFKVANAHNLPFKENFFDGVTCIEMMEHVEKPDQVLSEINRVLKKNGQILILVPTDNQLFKLIWKLWQLRYKQWKHAHVQSFTARSLDRLVSKNGFTIDTIDTFNLGMLKLITAHKNV